MASDRCRQYGETVVAGAAQCSHCGASLQEYSPQAPSYITVAVTPGTLQASASSGLPIGTVAGAFVTLSSFASIYQDARVKADMLVAAGAPPEAVKSLKEDLDKMASEQEKALFQLSSALRERDAAKVEKVDQEVKQRIPERVRSLERSELAVSIVTAISHVNLLFSSKADGATLLREDMQIANSFFTSVTRPEDFVVHVGSLAVLFDVSLDPLRTQLTYHDPGWKSIRLLEAWNVEKGGKRIPSTVFETWKNIVKLRSYSFPFHAGSDEIVTTVKSFGHGFPLDYGTLWDDVLRQFFDTLKQLQEALT